MQFLSITPNLDISLYHNIEDNLKGYRMLFLKQVNYPPTPKAMGWASWVKAPSNEGNVP